MNVGATLTGLTAPAGSAHIGPFPVGDPQFWIVTAFALAALYFLLRPLLPARLGGRRGKATGTRATLTIAGRPRNQ